MFNTTTVFVSGIISIYAAIELSKNMRMKKLTSSIRKAAANKKEQIEHICRNLKLKNVSIELESMISKYSITELSEGLRSQMFASEDITTVYIKRCIKYGRKYGWMADINFEEALEASKQADIKLAEAVKSKTLDQLSPMFGIPFSVKEHIRIKNLASTFGLSKLAHTKDEFDSVVVKVLREAGAIPFVKSTLNGAYMLPGSHLWGNPINPWNHSRVPGGSSMGEGGLISIGCSPFGFGSDIAGSIRQPSAFCGIAGLNPTSNRISSAKVAALTRMEVKNRTTIAALHVGPMAKKVEDLAIIMRTLCKDKAFKEDPIVAPIPFNEEQYTIKKKMKIGYYYNDGFVDVSPSVLRGIKEAVEILKSNGHELIEFKPKNINMSEAAINQWKLMILDNGKENNELIEAEYQLLTKANGLRFPQQIGILLSWIFRPKVEKRLSLLTNLSELDGKGIEKISEHHYEFRQKFIEEMKKLDLNAIICPSMPDPAQLCENKNSNFISTLLYAALYSYLNIPSGSVPITRVREDEETYESAYNDSITKNIKKNMIGSAGMPIGVQVASYPYNEEIVLNLMKQIEEKSNFNLDISKY